jgi:hypothetical protein
MKIGLITMHNVCNFGAVLQTYAMTFTLKTLGHECTIIDYIPDVRKGFRVYFPIERELSFPRKIMSWTKWLPVRIGWERSFNKFMAKNYELTPQKYVGNGSIIINPPIFDAYITGSDQVWNPDSTDGLNGDYFLSFVPKGKTKISYAASISAKCLSNKEKEAILSYLNDYKAISVREMQGKNLLKSIGIDKVEHVLDPTLLLTKAEWGHIADGSNIEEKDKYLLMYVLGSQPKLVKYAQKVARQRKLKIVKLGWDLKKTKGIDEIISFGTPQDFVKLFLNADYVVTNSFHGTAFSVNFNKDFIVLPSSNNNPRFTSILNMFGLQERCLNVENGIKDFNDSIDYTVVNTILQNERKISLDFLQNALKR